MLTDIKAVVFDLDGTLIDSMWLWRDIDIEYLQRFGYELPDDLQEAIAGISITQTAWYFKKRFNIPDPIEQIISDWDALAEHKYSHEVPLKADADKFLQLLKANQIDCGIATSNSSHLTRSVLNALGIAAYFKVVITGEDIHKGKPEPDIYLEAARRLDVHPSQCLVFEDITHGILAGRNAGMQVCAVEDAYSKHETERKKELANYYIRSFSDIFSNTYEECR